MQRKRRSSNGRNLHTIRNAPLTGSSDIRVLSTSQTTAKTRPSKRQKMNVSQKENVQIMSKSRPTRLIHAQNAINATQLTVPPLLRNRNNVFQPPVFTAGHVSKAFPTYQSLSNPPAAHASFLQTPETLSDIGTNVITENFPIEGSLPISPASVKNAKQDVYEEDEISQAQFTLSIPFKILIAKCLRIHSTLSSSSTAISQTQPRTFSKEKYQNLISSIQNMSRIFKFHRETEWVSSQFMQTYLSKRRIVHPHQLTLLSSTVFYIASKIEEEIEEPTIKELIYVQAQAQTQSRTTTTSAKALSVNDKISKSDVLKMEKKVLGILEWDLSYVTPHALICEFFDVLSERIGKGKSSSMDDVLGMVQFSFDFMLMNGYAFDYSALSIAIASFENVLGKFATVYGSCRLDSAKYNAAELFQGLIREVLNEHPGQSQKILEEVDQIRKILPHFE